MLTRKDFLRSALAGAAALGGLGATASGCGGGDDGDGGGAGDGCTAGSPTIASNHGHVLTVPPADLESTQTMTYSIKGSANHDHLVKLTPSHLASIKAGKTAYVESTALPTDDHSHNVAVKCG